jgi:hypothetical protein
VGGPSGVGESEELVVSDGDTLLWDLVEPMFADPAVTRSTMMGLPCVRYAGRFFATATGPRYAIQPPSARWTMPSKR